MGDGVDAEVGEEEETGEVVAGVSSEADGVSSEASGVESEAAVMEVDAAGGGVVGYVFAAAVEVF